METMETMDEIEMLKRNQDNPAQSDKAKSMMKNRIKFLKERCTDGKS